MNKPEARHQAGPLLILVILSGDRMARYARRRCTFSSITLCGT